MKINYEAGDLLLLTGGEYDDYGIIDVQKVVNPFNLRDLKNEYVNEWCITTNKTSSYAVHEFKPNCEHFEKWLITNGFTQSVEIEELKFTDCYGEFTLDLDD